VSLRAVAILTLFAFGCATVRIPVTSASDPEDAAGTIAPPVTELWLESSGDIPEEVALAADGQARAAMAAALAGREIPATAAGATDAVLFVRERAVGVTGERRSQQTWAKVGLVVGFVVVLVGAVYLATRGGGGKGSAPSSGKSGSAPRTVTPVSVKPRPAPAPAGHVPAPVAPRPVLGGGPPARGWNTSPFFFGFYFDFWIPPRPLVLAPEAEPEDPWGPPGPPAPLALDPAGPPSPAADVAEPPPPEPLAAIALQLPPLSDKVNFPVDDRGFFDGTRTAVQLDLVDRASGRLLWSNAVSSGADPLDAGDVTKLVDEALAGVSWAHRTR
jgi:hypothetical protein